MEKRNVAEERTKTRFKQKEKWFKENWNLNRNQELTKKIKQTYNNIKIWNQVEENLTKSWDILLSCAKEKVRKKLIETLDLRQKGSI